MKCDRCKAESPWLEIIGKDMVCHKCLQKNKVMGYVLKTHMDTFHYLIKKLNLTGFADYVKVTKEQIEATADLKKHGITLRKSK